MRTLQGCHPHGDRAALAVLHHQQAVRQQTRDAQIVGDDNHRQIQFAYQRAQNTLAVRINAHPTGLSPAWRPCGAGGAH
jgi:hypothetical protein